MSETRKTALYLFVAVATLGGTWIASISKKAVPAPDGVILVRGHVTLALPPGSQGRAAVALRRTINGVGPVACRSVEVVATTAGDPPPQTDSYTAFPLHVDCVIDNPLAGDSYVFTLFVDLGFGSWWYGDPSNGGASDTIYIDAVWHPAE